MTVETRTTLALDSYRMTEVRTIAGAIAADSATLSDANFPVASALDCRGCDTIWVSVEITGGAGPTCTIEALFRDEGAADGSRWQRIQTGVLNGITPTASATNQVADQVTSALTNLQQCEIRVDGWKQVYLRRTAVTNDVGTTTMKILARPGKTRQAPAIRFP